MRSTLGLAVAFHVEVAKMLEPLVLRAAVLVLVVAAPACGSPDRPATSDSLVTGEAALAAQPPLPRPAEPGMPPRLCEPRSHRECAITYVDEDGQLQCPSSIQICSVDGSEWLPCGAYVYDENHDPKPHP